MPCRLPHKLRPFVEEDRNFVTRGWVSEMRRSGFARHVPSGVYWPCQHELVRQALAISATLVACDQSDENHLYGCIVYQPAHEAIVHWLYVKGDYRRLGMASALLEAAIGHQRPVYCTQAPELFNQRSLVQSHELVHCPYLLLGIAPPQAARPPMEPDECPTPSL